MKNVIAANTRESGFAVVRAVYIVASQIFLFAPPGGVKHASALR